MPSIVLAMLDDNPDDVDIMAIAADDVGGVIFSGHESSESLVDTLVVGATAGDALGVLLDWHLPGDLSSRTLKALRAHPLIGHAFVMVNTGSDDPADRSAALGAGADAYSVKPTGYDASVALVAEVARLARNARVSP